MYQFTDDCRIGIPEIDHEHKKLYDLINQAYDLLSSEQTDFRLSMQIMLKRLKEYADTHFVHEEAYMKEIHDPELPSQKQEHAAFSHYISAFQIDRLDNTRVKAAFESLLEYLSRWLFRHILSSDALIGTFQSPFSFTKKYLTGIKLVDDEHKRLFEIIKNADEIIHAELLHDKYDEIVRILSELEDYTKEHFYDEELYMQKIEYPHLEAQHKAHSAFIDKISKINLEDVDEHQQDYLEHIVQFLLDWLTVHILHMDKKIGEFAAANGFIQTPDSPSEE